jgi:hypothetical protein
MAYAPPQGTPASSSPVSRESDVQVMLGTLRQLRTVAQFLDKSVAEVEEASRRTNDSERRAAMDGIAVTAVGPLDDGLASGNAYLAQAKAAVAASPYLRDWLGDEATRIELHWDEIARELAALRDELARRSTKRLSEVPDLVASLTTAARAALREVILAAASLTVPARLQQFLSETSVGHNLSFKSLFEDELPNEADRAEVLRRIAESAADLGGVVDLDTMTVIAVSPKASRRRLSYRLEAAALMFGGLVAYLIVAALHSDIRLGADGLNANAAALSALGALLVVFAGGACFHFVVDLIKAQQGALGSTTWAALDDWLLWLHAREVKVISSCLTLWLAFVGLLLLYPGTPDVLTAFLAGYSFDSLADLVIKRFDSVAGSKVGDLAKTLGATS